MLIGKLLVTHVMDKIKLVSEAIRPKGLEENEGKFLTDKESSMYRSSVDTLLYLAVKAQLDIAVVATMLSSFVAEPKNLT